MVFIWNVTLVVDVSCSARAGRLANITAFLDISGIKQSLDHGKSRSIS